MQPRLLPRKLAAEYCGVSVTHFLSKVAPYVPAGKIGEKRVWDVRKLDRWIDQLDGTPAVPQAGEMPDEHWLDRL